DKQASFAQSLIRAESHRDAQHDTPSRYNGNVADHLKKSSKLPPCFAAFVNSFLCFLRASSVAGSYDSPMRRAFPLHCLFLLLAAVHFNLATRATGQTTQPAKIPVIL